MGNLDLGFTSPLTDRELREYMDWAWLQVRRVTDPATFEAWLASPWGDRTVRHWLNETTAATGHMRKEY